MLCSGVCWVNVSSLSEAAKEDTRMDVLVFGGSFHHTYVKAGVSVIGRII